MVTQLLVDQTSHPFRSFSRALPLRAYSTCLRELQKFENWRWPVCEEILTFARTYFERAEREVM